jgi:hypothetical protein
MEKSESLDTTEEDYYRIISGKTASLFVAATKSAALAISAPDSFVEAISNYAYQLGLAFQIRDDIFDYTPGMDTGKIAGADIKERKITLPLLCAMRKAQSQEAEAVRKRIALIDNSVVKGGNISEKEMEIIATVNEFVQKYSGIAESQAILEEHSRKAIESLSILPDSKAKERLVQLARFVGTRNRQSRASRHSMAGCARTGRMPFPGRQGRLCSEDHRHGALSLLPRKQGSPPAERTYRPARKMRSRRDMHGHHRKLARFPHDRPPRQRPFQRKPHTAAQPAHP